MAKPARSPLLGYNHNVRYGGQIFHVQTEDSGPGNPHIFTHLFFEGSILASKRSHYDPETPEDDVRGLMQGQHKAILKELKQGVFGERITRFFEMRGETFKPDAALAAEAQSQAPAAEVAAPPAEVAPMAPEPETLPISAHEEAPVPPAQKIELLPEGSAQPDATPSVAEAVAAAAVVSPAVLAEAGMTEPLVADAEEPSQASAVLDLDALPTPTLERTRTPEPLPIHATQPAVPGPGTYTLRRPVREEAPDAAAKTRQPPSARPSPAGPIMPVVVQRQVVVGAGGGPITIPRKTPTTPVRRRPVSGGPYVVKEGSHADIVGATASRKAAAAPRPVVPAPEAPRTAAPKQQPPSQEGTPSVLVSDQSLDDVILAYLSHGERKS